MNPLAENLNNDIKNENVNVFEMLSDLGKIYLCQKVL